MNVQWYPGHMTKAKRNMQEDCRLVDLIIELVDARVPLSSRNPDIDRLGQGKARLILMNKSDLADPALSAVWKAWFESRGAFVVLLDARASSGMKAVNRVIEEACHEKRERDRKRGILNRPVRAMVVGIPNVGKSTFINTFAGRAAAKTGNKPGVTRGNQWIRLNKNVELLDTPGILWPKFEDQQVGIRLAAIGSINDNILDLTELCGYVIRFLHKKYPGALRKRYPAVEEETAAKENGAYAILEEIARLRGCVGRGGEPDVDKAVLLVLDDFRSGRLGQATLEEPMR
ncbi:MAG: ribosome biogenesis GTPase YlqF [Lachnospiraceae bacterium]|jgi:ribosome biogenesis GTPase A|nr:ribosome biogenesis GTPase YlqF [Lachnospiraceae bacterium]